MEIGRRGEVERLEEEGGGLWGVFSIGGSDKQS